VSADRNGKSTATVGRLAPSVEEQKRRRGAWTVLVIHAAIDGVTVFGYWSRLNTVPFLADPRGAPSRGLDVAVTATTRAIRLRAVRHRKLADFGLIPWPALAAIDGVGKTVGVDVEAKGGVITISSEHPVTPYAKIIELFPVGQTSTVAAQQLRATDPRPVQ